MVGLPNRPLTAGKGGRGRGSPPRAHVVLEAMSIAGYAIGAQQGYIYVRAEYPIAVKRLQVAISQARDGDLHQAGVVDLAPQGEHLGALGPFGAHGGEPLGAVEDDLGDVGVGLHVYPIAVKRLQVAISQAREMGLLGKNILGTGFNFDIDIRLGAGAFVCGSALQQTYLIPLGWAAAKAHFLPVGKPPPPPRSNRRTSRRSWRSTF